MLGPIDYIVVGFSGNNFDGSIMTELTKAIENGTIRLIDLVFVVKASDGTVAVGEVEDQSDDLLEALKDYPIDTSLPLVSEADLAEIGESLEANSSAAILVIEQLWAKGLKEALLKADGQLLAEGRVHADDVSAALSELEVKV